VPFAPGKPACGRGQGGSEARRAGGRDSWPYGHRAFQGIVWPRGDTPRTPVGAYDACSLREPCARRRKTTFPWRSSDQDRQRIKPNTVRHRNNELFHRSVDVDPYPPGQAQGDLDRPFCTL